MSHMSFFCFFSPTSHHLDSPFAKIQRFSLRLCNSVALDIRFRPSSCSKRCTVQRAKNPKKAPPQRPLTVRWFGSPVRRLRGVLRVLLPWRVETSSFFTGIFRFVCYLLPPPKKKGLWVTQQLPDQDQACHLRVDHVDHVDDIQELEGLTIYFPSLDCTSL